METTYKQMPGDHYQCDVTEMNNCADNMAEIKNVTNRSGDDCGWRDRLKKFGVFVICTFTLAIVLYIALPYWIDEALLTVLLYSCLSIAMMSLGVLTVSYYQLCVDNEQKRAQCEQLENSITMETAANEALIHESDHFREIIVALKTDKHYLTKENQKLWREIELLQVKIHSLESCLERMTDSATSDEDEEDEDDNLTVNGECCIVCMERERDIVTLPCKHLCMCTRCASKIKYCPLCRKKVKKSVKIFKG